MDPFIQGLDEEAAARVRGWVEVRERGGMRASRLSGSDRLILKRVPTPLPALQASKTPTSPFIAPGQQAQVCAPPST